MENGKCLHLLVGLLSRTGTNMKPSAVTGPGDELVEEVASLLVRWLDSI